MSILEIVKEPDPILRKQSKEVKNVDESLQRLMDNMLETMYSTGNWISCTTSRNFKRVIVIDLAKEDEPKTIIYY